MPQVPSATRCLQVLRFLAAQPEPVPLARIAAGTGLPRSSAYHLVAAMIEEGFVVHLADDGTYGLGVTAFEVGSGYSRQAPLQRIARRPIAALVERVGHSAHLAVPHGRDMLYVIEERAPGRPSLVTDVGVRLPAHLTASGRAVLAALPANQVRALFPSAAAFADRTGVGPRSLTELRRVLVDTRRRGHAVEQGEITPGFASVAAAILDHNDHPVAAVALTYPGSRDEGLDLPGAAAAVRRTASEIATRIHGRVASAGTVAS